MIMMGGGVFDYGRQKIKTKDKAHKLITLRIEDDEDVRL